MLTTDSIYILDDLYRTFEDSFCSGNSKAIEPDGVRPTPWSPQDKRWLPYSKKRIEKIHRTIIICGHDECHHSLWGLVLANLSRCQISQLPNDILMYQQLRMLSVLVVCQCRVRGATPEHDVLEKTLIPCRIFVSPIIGRWKGRKQLEMSPLDVQSVHFFKMMCLGFSPLIHNQQYHDFKLIFSWFWLLNCTFVTAKKSII